MISRNFDQEKDFNRLQAFLGKMRKKNPSEFFHYGDLVFRVYKASNHFDLREDIRVWETDDEIAGFTLYTSVDANPEYMINPSYYGQIFDEAVNWSVMRAKKGYEQEIETGCIEGDTLKESFLLKAGFKKIDDPYVFMRCSLEGWSRGYQLPKSYMLKTAKEEPTLYGIEVTEDKEAYMPMVQAPGYRDELGLRAVYNGNEIVAGCICWLDTYDMTAEFEPVGTVEAHRGKGLAYSLMVEVMQRLKEQSIKEVYVRTGGGNIPAIKLYEKLGFNIESLDIGYQKGISRELD